MELNHFFEVEMFPRINWRKPFNGYQDEEFYYVLSCETEINIVKIYLNGATEFTMIGDEEYFYRVLPSEFNDRDFVIYKIKKAS